MAILIKQANVYAPQALGSNDILLGGTKILYIGENAQVSMPSLDIIDAHNLIAIPGLIDPLVHISGGGGEGGFHTRTPEMTLTEATLSGVTTVVGALGTDGTTRTLPDLLAKARGLDHEGLSTYCYTGSYELPARTLLGNVTDDILMIDKFIGIGEVAIADHRSSQPTMEQLASTAAAARVGGMLSGKAGIVFVHVGDSDSKLALLHQVIESSDVPITQFYPTHMNRNQALLDAGVAWCKLGGYIDVTTSTNEQFIADGEIPAAQAVAYCLSQGVPPAQITMSSDGNASLPVFNEAGDLVGLEVGRVQSLITSLRELITRHSVTLTDAVSCVTKTPASILRLDQKGNLATNYDADLVLLDKHSLEVVHVFARGQWLVKNGEAIKKGTFE